MHIDGSDDGQQELAGETASYTVRQILHED